MFYLLVSFDESDSRLELHNLALRANLKTTDKKNSKVRMCFVDIEGLMHFVAKDLKTKIIYVITCALIHPTIMFTILLIRINTLIV